MQSSPQPDPSLTNAANPALIPQILPSNAAAMAQQHVQQIISSAFEFKTGDSALLIYDRDCPLAACLAEAYQASLPDARCLNFTEHSAEAILQEFTGLAAGSLVVLVQSTHFRLEAYRLRVELFKLGLKVIEHPHLARMQGDEATLYLQALAYDADYLRGTGQALKALIDQASLTTIDSGEALLSFAGPLEAAKLNVGDYRAMKNYGGQFPIGEVFTESVDLAQVSGKVKIFAFGDTQFLVNRPVQPITLVVERGQVVATENSTPEFEAVLANIRRDEDGVVWLRELGFGLNTAFSKSVWVRDVGTYERMCGVHLSLGAKHGSYAKPHIKRGEGRYHVDVFVDTQAVCFDGQPVYADGRWHVGL